MAQSDPIDDPENGFYDVRVTVKLIVTLSGQGKVDEWHINKRGESAHANDMVGMGSGIENFLDSDDVHNVVRSTYLRDLDTHQER